MNSRLIRGRIRLRPKLNQQRDISSEKALINLNELQSNQQKKDKEKQIDTKQINFGKEQVRAI